MAEYPNIASQLKIQLDVAFGLPGEDSLDALVAGTSDSAAWLAACSFVAQHMAWVTRNEATRRTHKVVVWKNVIDWNGVFEAHIHIHSDKRARRGIYANLTQSSYTAIVKILPGNLKKDGTFSSELYDWSIESKPYSAVDGKFKTDGKTRFELRPNPLRPFRGREIDYIDPEGAEVET